MPIKRQANTSPAYLKLKPPELLAVSKGMVSSLENTRKKNWVKSVLGPLTDKVNN